MFSIIIPVHNSEKILSKGLDSVLSQSYTNFEVLLIENGSSDNTLKLCKEYEEKDSRIKVSSIGPCNGPSRARNYGLDKALGEYIVFVDAGDPIEPGYFADLEEAFKSADIVFSGYIIKDNVGNAIGEVVPKRAGDTQQLICYNLYKQDCFGYTVVKAIRKNVIGDVRFDESLNLFEDELFTLEVLKKPTEISVLPKAYYHYELTDDALTKITHKDMIDKKEKLYKAWKEFLAGFDKEILEIAESYVTFVLNYIFERELDRKSSIETLKKTTFYNDIVSSGKKVNVKGFFLKRDLSKALKK